ncbi:MAG: glycoside hydrolase family 97 C-terminal domain-containing protein [Planctomycetota bacterium]
MRDCLKHVCLDRHKGKDWFIGRINAEEPRELTLFLDFLTAGAYSIRLYRDSADGRETAVK